MKTRAFLIIVLAIVALAAVVAVLNFTLRGSRYETAIPIRAHLVAKGTLEDRVSGNGTFKPRTSITVASQVSGEVESILVRENDRVRKGELMMELKSDDYQLTLRKARAALESARRGVSQSLVTLRAQYRSAQSAQEEARRAFEKNKELFAAKAISEEIYRKSSDAVETTRGSLQSAREQLNLRRGYALDAEPALSADQDVAIIEGSPEVVQALLSVQSAQDTISRCAIAAPLAGIVTMVRPSLGDVVAPSTPLVKIETLDDMLAEIQIDEVDIGKIREGQPAEIASDSLIGTALRGTVESISPTITTLGSTRVSLVRVAVQRGSTILRSGASCTARVTTSTRQDALLIPLASFVTEEKTAYAFVLKPIGRSNGAGAEIFQLSRKEISTGSSDVNYVEITAGLAEGDRIATGNLKLLREGVLVTEKTD